MCLAQGPQRSDAGEARTRGPSVSSQALYHWATALPMGPNWYSNDIPALFDQQECTRAILHSIPIQVMFYTKPRLNTSKKIQIPGNSKLK